MATTGTTEHERNAHMGEPHETSGPRISAKAIAWIVVAVLTIVFVVQNTEKTEVKFLFFDVNVGIWLALVVAVVLGLLLGFFLGRRTRD